MEKSEKSLRGNGELIPFHQFANEGERNRESLMNKKAYRQRMIAQERALSPRIFRQYVRKVSGPRNWALLAEIHAEIAPRIPAEILPDIVPPVVRFASRRKGEAQAVQGESRFALCSGGMEYGVGAIDRDEIAGGEEREITPVLPVEPVEKEASE